MNSDPKQYVLCISSKKWQWLVVIDIIVKECRKTPVETHYKNTYFGTHPDKNVYRRKLKDRFTPPQLQCC